MSDTLSYTLQKFAINALSKAPLQMLYLCSSIAYYCAFYVIRWRRKLVYENLTNAFPDKSDKERQHMSQSHFRALFDTSVETLKTETLDMAELRERVSFENLELLEGLADQPFLLVSAHQGNWEWQNLILADRLSIPVDAIYATVPSRALNEFLLISRARNGTRLIEQSDTLMAIAKRLKEPRAVVMLADQNPRRDAERYWLKFLEQDPAFGVGIEKIARLTKYPVVFQHGYRTRRGHYRMRFQMLTSPPYDKEGHAIIDAYAHALEGAIKQNPADWLWSYQRWRYPKPLYA